MSVWNHGLTLEQVAKCDAVLAEPREYTHFAKGTSYEHFSNYALEGWSMYRCPSTLNPPTVVRMRYRDGQGKLLIDVDCS